MEKSAFILLHLVCALRDLRRLQKHYHVLARWSVDPDLLLYCIPDILLSTLVEVHLLLRGWGGLVLLLLLF